MNAAQKAVFDMVALVNVEVRGVQYKKDDVFSVQGIDTVRWLEANGSAKSKSSMDAAAAAKKTAPSPASATPADPVGNAGTTHGNEVKSPAPSAAPIRARRT